MAFHTHLYGLVQKGSNNVIKKTWSLSPGQGLLVTSDNDVVSDKFTTYSQAQQASILGKLEIFAVLDEEFGLLMTHVLHPKKSILAYRHSGGSQRNSIQLSVPTSKSYYKGTIGKTIHEAQQLATQL